MGKQYYKEYIHVHNIFVILYCKLYTRNSHTVSVYSVLHLNEYNYIHVQLVHVHVHVYTMTFPQKKQNDNQ